MESIRINKYLSDAGVCSRREADRLLEAGRIAVNGKRAVPGERVNPKDQIKLDGKEITREEKKVVLLFHKPRGIVCSTKQQRNETTVTEYLNYPLRVYPVGRLDKESEGLLLLTNRGDLVNAVMRAGNFHEKEYLVSVDHVVTDEFLRGMQKGVPVLDTVTRPCKAERIGKYRFRIILTQGLNRQIRRMCEYFGYHVTSLQRVRIMNLKLDGIPLGQYREISREEWKTLREMLESSPGMTENRTGGDHGDIHKGNERAGRKAQQGGKGILPGRQGNYEQSGIRRPVRAVGTNGKRNRHRSGKQSDYKRRV